VPELKSRDLRPPFGWTRGGNQEFNAWMTWRKKEESPCEGVGAANQLLQSVYERGHKQQITDTFANMFTREHVERLDAIQVHLPVQEMRALLARVRPVLQHCPVHTGASRDREDVPPAIQLRDPTIRTGTDAESLAAITVSGGIKKQKDIPGIKKVTTNHCIPDFNVWLKPFHHWIIRP
jgi:hypothetical protein